LRGKWLVVVLAGLLAAVPVLALLSNAGFRRRSAGSGYRTPSLRRRVPLRGYNALTYARIGDVRLTFDLLLPADDGDGRPVVVWLTSSGGRRARRGVRQTEALVAEGFAVALLSVGPLPGVESPLTNPPRRAREAIAYLRRRADTYGLDARRVALAARGPEALLVLQAGLGPTDWRGDDARQSPPRGGLTPGDGPAAGNGPSVPRTDRPDRPTPPASPGETDHAGRRNGAAGPGQPGRPDAVCALVGWREFWDRPWDESSTGAEWDLQARLASPDDPPTLLLVGRSDGASVEQFARDLAAALSDHDVPAEVIPLYDDEDGDGPGRRGMRDTAAVRHLTAFLRRHMPARSPGQGRP
jgi:hypothetical protein